MATPKPLLEPAKIHLKNHEQTVISAASTR